MQNNKQPTDNDQQFMRHALRLAVRGLGNVYPNPAVGAVIVNDEAIVGRGWTARGGRPHAETVALAQAGGAAKGATLYVTLEPCAHHGKTPPCTESLIKAGIRHVVAACTDPNPLVAGKGFEQLRSAGIEVTEKVCEAEALKLNEGFFSVIKHRRPLISLKIATSLDGRIATANGESKWITSEASRRMGHYLRAQYDAILTGSGTVLNDNPMLTCRLPGREADSPQRVVIDTHMKIYPDASVFPAWVFISENAGMNTENVFTVEKEGDHISLSKTLEILAGKGITRLLVEAGNRLSSAFIDQELVDRIYWFRAPVVIGKMGLDALNGQDVPLSDLRRYNLQEVQKIGEDVLEIYELNKA